MRTIGQSASVFSCLVLAAWAMLFVASSAGRAEEVRKIEDNSFLIEEAYNQEPGVIQHIQSFQYMRDKQWAYTFVQEWPVPGRTHQFSYNIPVFRLDVEDEGRTTGFGDVQLNYRYQLVDKKDFVAIAPRLSLILPTGDHREDFGRGALGYQTNIPVSLTLADKWVNHWNAGMTFTPNARGPAEGRRDTLDFNAGTSVIYLLAEKFNLLLEAVWNAPQSVDEGSREHSLFINPGFRFALDFDSGLQIVPGIGFPIGVGNSSGEYGVFFYLSFEHPFPRLYGKQSVSP
ncbi:MAG: transporter [Desulfobacteraceae bacterium]|nr:MAG: transporter [Desulfobacteraceae bacterium]